MFEIYNSIFTFHGVIIIFFYLVPFVYSCLGNWIFSFILNLQDLKFPRFNLISFHLLISSYSPILFSSFHSIVSTSWVLYPPNSTSIDIELLVLSLHLNGLSRFLGSINFISTFLLVGIEFYDSIVFCFISSSFLLILGLPAVIICLSILVIDRSYGTYFFVDLEGGRVISYMHLFWWFGHPEVYVVALPSFGSLSLFISSSYSFPWYYEAVASILLICFLGLIVWAHHMFVDVDWDRRYFFSLMSLLVGLPTGNKVFTWIYSLGGIPLSFVLDSRSSLILMFLSLFTFGGITGIFLSCIGIDYFFHDTYYVVAHFHYVISISSTLGGYLGLSYTLNNLSYVSSERSGIHSSNCLIFILSNFSFMPMHFLGLYSIPRRYISYSIGLNCYSFISSLRTSFLIPMVLMSAFYWIIPVILFVTV